LIELKETGQPLHAQVVGKKLAPDAIIDVPCDIWNPTMSRG
jgi:hypothetical protein